MLQLVKTKGSAGALRFTSHGRDLCLTSSMHQLRADIPHMPLLDVQCWAEGNKLFGPHASACLRTHAVQPEHLLAGQPNRRTSRTSRQVSTAKPYVRGRNSNAAPGESLKQACLPQTAVFVETRPVSTSARLC